jgi:predicted dehydrogenase
MSTENKDNGTGRKKIAVVGAGSWGKNLVRNFHEMGLLSAVAEANDQLRRELEKQLPGVSFHGDYTSLLDAGIDAVAIATPVPTHAAIAEQFLRAGMDVFVEKPMTLSRNEAVRLVQTADAENRILMVGYLLLYQPAIQFIKSFLAEGKLGRLYHLHQERQKLGRARYVENVTWSLGVHDLAVLLYLVGMPPRHVFASGHCGLQKRVEDDVYVHLTFADGIKAHLHNSWLWPENRRRLTIVGEKGILVYDEPSSSVTLHHKTIDQELTNHDEGEELVYEGHSAPLRLELEHFRQCIEKRQQPISDGRNGLLVVETLERILMI